MKKCRKISAQEYVHKRMRAEGACLRKDRKIPTSTKSTKTVGSLSSKDSIEPLRDKQCCGLLADEAIERRYHSRRDSDLSASEECYVSSICSVRYGCRG